MERGDINLDWFKYKNYFTTNVNTNAWATVEGFGFTQKINEDDYLNNVVADVTDSYKELSSERIYD